MSNPILGSAANNSSPQQFYLNETHHSENGSVLGFWIYLMSDCLLFAILFATFAVLNQNFAGGPTPQEIFELPLVAMNTGILLLSSLTYGFAMLAVKQNNSQAVIAWLSITAALGLAFLAVELHEFNSLLHEGAGPQRSAFLSAFFILVGTHGLHVFFGFIWIMTMIAQIHQRNLIEANQRRLLCLSLFWHFLDVIWIAVFSFVYLIGAA